MKSKTKSYNKKPVKKVSPKKAEPKEVTAYHKIVENKDVDKLYPVEDQEAFEEGCCVESEDCCTESEECPCCEEDCKCCDHP